VNSHSSGVGKTTINTGASASTPGGNRPHTGVELLWAMRLEGWGRTESSDRRLRCAAWDTSCEVMTSSTSTHRLGCGGNASAARLDEELDAVSPRYEPCPVLRCPRASFLARFPGSLATLRLDDGGGGRVWPASGAAVVWGSRSDGTSPGGACRSPTSHSTSMCSREVRAKS
jgi:hypothetical protein